jgi:hypothetical protein
VDAKRVFSLISLISRQGEVNLMGRFLGIARKSHTAKSDCDGPQTPMTVSDPIELPISDPYA